jgi:hypothetical protein
MNFKNFCYLYVCFNKIHSRTEYLCFRFQYSILWSTLIWRVPTLLKTMCNLQKCVCVCACTHMEANSQTTIQHLLHTVILTLHPHKPWNRNSLCNFKGNPLVKYHLPLPTIHNTCGNTNVLLRIIISSDTAPCRFVSTSYTDNSLEYSVVKVLYTNNSALTNKIYLVRNHLHHTWRELRCYLWSEV